MAKKEHPYTVVYVYAPIKYKDEYMRGRSIPNVKIGETTSDADDCDTCMEAAMKRINQQSTGFKEYMYLLQWFVFPYKKNTDDAIRKILTEDIYHLSSSKKVDGRKNDNDKRMTKIGQEFAYDVNIAQVNTAISVYKLKTKMEELIDDRGIDPMFKDRLRGMVKELIVHLDDVVEECAHNYSGLPFIEKHKINLFNQMFENDFKIDGMYFEDK